MLCHGAFWTLLSFWYKTEVFRTTNCMTTLEFCTKFHPFPWLLNLLVASKVRRSLLNLWRRSIVGGEDQDTHILIFQQVLRYLLKAHVDTCARLVNLRPKRCKDMKVQLPHWQSEGSSAIVPIAKFLDGVHDTFWRAAMKCGKNIHWPVGPRALCKTWVLRGKCVGSSTSKFVNVCELMKVQGEMPSHPMIHISTYIYIYLCKYIYIYTYITSVPFWHWDAIRWIEFWT